MNWTNGKRRFAQLKSEENTSPTLLPETAAPARTRELRNRSVGQRNPQRDPVGMN